MTWFRPGACWSARSRTLVVYPATTDWAASGEIEIYLREKPSPQNRMGKIKLRFPNNLAHLSARRTPQNSYSPISSEITAVGACACAYLAHNDLPKVNILRQVPRRPLWG